MTLTDLADIAEILGVLAIAFGIVFGAILVGGAAILIGDKLKRYIDESRHSQDHELLFEWFQWLVERLVERGEGSRSPAFEAHRDWRE
jgi:hypothetical protein